MMGGQLCSNLLHKYERRASFPRAPRARKRSARVTRVMYRAHIRRTLVDEVIETLTAFCAAQGDAK